MTAPPTTLPTVRDRRRGRRQARRRCAACIPLAVLLLWAAAGQGLAPAALPVSTLALWPGDRRMRRPGTVPVIAHHSVAPNAGRPPWADSASVRAQVFRRHMQALRDAGRRFQCFTGGRGERRPGDDPDMLSRAHVHDRAFGGGPLWLKTPGFRARLGAMGGNLYRAPGLMADALLRRCRPAAPGGHE